MMATAIDHQPMAVRIRPRFAVTFSTDLGYLSPPARHGMAWRGQARLGFAGGADQPVRGASGAERLKGWK